MNEVKMNRVTQENTAEEKLLDLLRNNLPEKCVLVKERHYEMLRAKEVLDQILETNGEKKSECQYHPGFLCGSLTAEFEDIEVHNILSFRAVMQNADNFEIYALENGKIRIAFMFHKLMRPIQ